MFKLARLAIAAALVAALPSPAVNAQIRELKIVLPAAPGGGWDQTGRPMQAALLAAIALLALLIARAYGKSTSAGDAIE